jgi:hypothetical protein
MRSRARACLLAAAAAAGGCHKADDAGKPSAVPPLDPSALPSALPTELGNPSAGAGRSPLPASGPPSATAVALPVPPARPAPAGDASKTTGDSGAGVITGKITLAAAVAKARPSGTLYLVARRPSDNPDARGTLIAVKRMPADRFPLPFNLTAADMPFQNGPFDGELTLSARIDQDGDPLTHEKGDVFGTLPAVKVGARNVKLVLDQVQKQTESLAGGGPMAGGSGPAARTPAAGELPPGHP